ncbi:GMC family oxidoreductase N-terminal domain-containing protein [Caenibius sp. WL]|uniref:GMC family oxidoreductase n=1 Tax=Caenibius sp. WL TaxID=2872646 RepID=UPI001C9910E1|nr:GMC family oxidoreductase N-terminal domain-containing protein [Caenibius sp. WL]QZP08962.1 GMC family oxidoreductase N-terminal domain-containing protein [Caenibius sp. WL]
MQYDYVIVGGGSAGCVLVNRLSSNPRNTVLLIEAGPDVSNLGVRALIAMPKGLVRLLDNPAVTYAHATDWGNQFGEPERGIVVRGRMLGGSSALNGLLYHRGQPQDYDRWAELGNTGWSWRDVLPYFMALEDHALGATDWRGRGGPLALTMTPPTRLGDAMIAAAETLGLPRKVEPNLTEQRGISYICANIDRWGRRVSAAKAFLSASVRKRPNLHIATDTRVDRLIFEGRRIVAVSCMRGGTPISYKVGKEAILSAGALQSPTLLQRSGIGAADMLGGLGIEVVHANPNVGANLRDHWNNYAAFALKFESDCQNREFRGWRLARNVLRYFAMGAGPLATATHHVAGFAATQENTGRADFQFVSGPYTMEVGPKGRMITSDGAAMNFYSYPLRTTSEGSVRIRSADPGVAPDIHPNYLATDHDRRIMVDGARFIRKLVRQMPLADLVGEELAPSAGAHSDDEILAVARQYGTPSAHTCGTCRMGPDDDRRAVLDPQLRVRGVAGLRVVDGSFFPEMISANTNGPIMAMALRAADLILNTP